MRTCIRFSNRLSAWACRRRVSI